MPSAIVTGATGFVGSHLVDHLLERGWRVTCTVRRTSSLRWLEGKPVERLEVDFRKPFALPESDAVFHVAGVVKAGALDEYRLGNWLASKHAVEAARCGRFIHVSTIAVSGPGEVDETTPCRPVSLYGRTKWEGEQEVWKHRDRLPVTVIRPPIVYGPRDPALLDLYRALAKGLRPEIGRAKRVSLVHVRDLVEGMVAAAEHPRAAGECFFLSDSAWPMTQLMDRIVDALGKRFVVRVRVPDRVVRFLAGVAEDALALVGKSSMFNRDKAGEMTQPAWVCSAAKAERLLGWRARVPVDSGLRETVAWYRREGLL